MWSPALAHVVPINNMVLSRTHLQVLFDIELSGGIGRERHPPQFQQLCALCGHLPRWERQRQCTKQYVPRLALRCLRRARFAACETHAFCEQHKTVEKFGNGVAGRRKLELKAESQASSEAP